jgi:hypothetical protein
MDIAVRPLEIASVVAAGVARLDSRVAAGRDCGTCTLCCKVAAVEEVAKPNGVWCSHCVKEKRCTIYDQRPASCRSFYCQWMLEPTLGPEWKPERAKFAMVKSEGGRRLTALVDPGFPSAWRRSPYYENLKQWAVDAARKSPDLYFVDVLIGARSIVILPDRDVDLGTLGPDEMIQFGYRMTETGRVAEVRKVRRTVAAA